MRIFLYKKGDKSLLSDSDHKSYSSEKEIHLNLSENESVCGWNNF